MLQSHLVKSDNSVRGRDDWGLGTISSLGQIETWKLLTEVEAAVKVLAVQVGHQLSGAECTEPSACSGQSGHPYWLGRPVKWVSACSAPCCRSLIPSRWEGTEVLTMRLLVVSCAPLVSSFTLSLACLLLTAISMHIKHDCEGPEPNLQSPSVSVCVLLPVSCLLKRSHTYSLSILLFDFTLPSCHGCFDVFLLLGSLLFLQELDFSPRWRWHARWVT